MHLPVETTSSFVILADVLVVSAEDEKGAAAAMSICNKASLFFAGRESTIFACQVLEMPALVNL